MSDSGQKFIRRNRAPRVHIAYDDPYDANKKIELPFVMGVLADLSGNNAGSEKPDMADRNFLDVDMDNFDARMKAINPGVTFKVDNKLGEGGDKLGVDLRFEKMADDDSHFGTARPSGRFCCRQSSRPPRPTTRASIPRSTRRGSTRCSRSR